ncbi:MAG: PatB family C-S lyase [Chloroflexota bacterium]|nr:PatB family C-S lyase [Chloroflexota bacterium]
MQYDFDRTIDRCSSDSVKWRRYGEGVIPLWVGDMDFLSPEPVVRALHVRAEHGVFGYGAEPAELRSVIVERLERLYGWRVSPDWMAFTPGVVVGFNLACRAIASPGDGMLVQTPLYYPILRVPVNAGLGLDEMELTRCGDGRYDIDFDAFEAAIGERTRVFVLCNPHNPVGRVFRRDELERMAEICLRHDVAICSDEIHCDLVFSGSEHVPIASLAPEIAEHTITLMAPSKTFNIPGLRCSVAIIANEELRRRFEAARVGLVPNPNIMGYVAALAAYRQGEPWLEQLLRYLEANRDFLLGYVESRLPGIEMGRPEATYFAWLDCRRAGIAGSPFEFFLEKARVALSDGPQFGRGGEGYVRLNFACPRAMLEAALECMRQALTAGG